MKKIENDTILFQYALDDLFNNVSLKSSYKARVVSDDKRVADDMSMLDDDKDAFRINLQKILPDIYERIVKLTSSVDNAYTVDQTNVAIRVQNNDAFNGNVLDVVDASIYDCLEMGSLKEWYSICGKMDYEQEYAVKYNAALSLLSNRMFQLKKKTIKNTLGNLE